MQDHDRVVIESDSITDRDGRPVAVARRGFSVVDRRIFSADRGTWTPAPCSFPPSGPNPPDLSGVVTLRDDGAGSTPIDPAAVGR